MPIPMPTELSSQDAGPQILTEYPVTSKQIAGLVDGQVTDVTTMYFTDKIMVTITQSIGLAQWLQVPLGSSNPGRADHFLPSGSADESLLPMPHLTASTLLGSSTPHREAMGHLYAVQIASNIALKNPEEQRPVVIGLGLARHDISRERFFDIIDIVTRCL
ncbi:hypothetical protein MMC26_004890 [Xylographa opegraphella]|nr:hypothetical protein [Xylographa opegraphella]